MTLQERIRDRRDRQLANYGAMAGRLESILKRGELSDYDKINGEALLTEYNAISDEIFADKVSFIDEVKI